MVGIIFDCDGVLADSEKYSCASWLPVLERRGLRVSIEDIEPFIGKSDAALIEAFRQRGVPDLDDNALQEREREYFALVRGRLTGFPGEIACLEALKRERIPMAVASSGRHEKIAFTLDELGISGFFDAICSSTEVANGKPAPDVFLLAAARLGIDPGECSVIEDSIAGIEAARAAGMTALGFTSTYEASVLLQAGAHRVFAHYDDLVKSGVKSLCQQ